MRIALVAYGCEPDRGSEQGVGWSFLNEILLRGHEVTVYVHGSQRAAIENDSSLGKLPVLFKFIQPGNWPLEHPSRFVHQVHYTIWQWRVADRIRRDDAVNAFDFVHYVTWGGIRMPTFGWRQTKPYIIGPVGGGEEAPLALCGSISKRLLIKETFRKVLNRICLFDPLLWLSYGQAYRTFAKTSQSRKFLPPWSRHKCDIRFEIGARDELLAGPAAHVLETDADATHEALAEKFESEPLRIIFVGRMLAWKAPSTAIATFVRLISRGVDARLTIVGTGPEEPKIKAMIDDLIASKQIDKGQIDLIPAISQPNLFDLMRTQSIALFTSLHDSSGNFVLEAMSMGLPVVALSLGGPYELLRKGGGEIVDVDGKGHSEVVRELADRIEALHADRSTLLNRAQEARRNAALMRWPDVVGRIYGQLENELQSLALNRLSDKSRNAPVAR